LWVVALGEGGNTVVDYTIWVNSASVDHPHEITLQKYSYEVHRDEDPVAGLPGNAEPSLVPMAGAGQTLVFLSDHVRRVSSRQAPVVGACEEPFAVSDGRLACQTSFGEGRSTGAIFETASGGKLATFHVEGMVLELALSRRVLAVLMNGRIEMFDPESGAARGGVAVDANAGDLSAAGDRIVFRVGQTIMLLKAATKRLTELAEASATPIGLSIESRRVACRRT
jgi:hypothetical protein